MLGFRQTSTQLHGMASHNDHDAWYAEAEAMEFDDAGPFEVADAADLPDEIAHHAEAAELDDDYQDEWERWFDRLSEDLVVLLVLEQCCSDGVLLPLDMRGARLLRALPQAVDTLHHFWRTAPEHLSVCLSHYVYWVVRAERARRRGTPYWSPASPLPPEKKPEPFYRLPTM
jgi:hypothetical protein